MAGKFRGKNAYAVAFTAWVIFTFGAGAFMAGMFYIALKADIRGVANDIVDISSIEASLLPNATDLHDMGTDATRWKDAYFSGTVKSDILRAESYVRVDEVAAPTGAAGRSILYHDTSDDILKVKTNSDTARAVALSTAAGTAGTSPTFVALTTSGATTLGTTLDVTGATTLASTLAVTGAATLSSTVAVTGTATFNGNVALGNAATDTITMIGADVTQATSVTTGVTVNGSSGKITTVSVSINAAVSNAFTVTNSVVTAASRVYVNVVDYSGVVTGLAGIPYVYVDAIASGSFSIVVANPGTSTLAGVLIISYLVVN